MHPPWAVRPARAASISGDGRVLTGTAAALAAVAGVDPVIVRLGFVVLGLAGGWGVVLYLLCWLTFAFVWTPPPRQHIADPALDDGLREIGVGLVVAGLLVQARVWGLGFSDTLVWPVALLAVAVAVVWRRVGSVEVAGLLDPEAPSARWAALRVIAGGALALAGTASLRGVDLSFGDSIRATFGLFAAIAGIAVVFGPTVKAMSTALLSERSERIRADERAVISSHLHDSVLQTLALIQKRAEDPAEVASLARRQERELRTWLYGERGETTGTIGAAIEAAAAEIDELHRVAVECVVVGDRALDAEGEAVVAAAREAMVNAAKFSGTSLISLYAEITPDTIEVFVRDRGRGFDAAAVADDRRGIADSIIGRIERIGGTAVIRSAPGEGTEVRLRTGGGDRSESAGGEG